MLRYDSELNLFTSSKNSKSKILEQQCRICGALAKYSHFGVISCSSCNVFLDETAMLDKSVYFIYFNRIFILIYLDNI
jgi:hypothetical protein